MAQGDVFDMLMTMTEFSAFKELILSYKQENMDTAKSLEMTMSTNGLHIYADEQVRANIPLCKYSCVEILLRKNVVVRKYSCAIGVGIQQ
jgi:hypothetical protein